MIFAYSQIDVKYVVNNSQVFCKANYFNVQLGEINGTLREYDCIITRVFQFIVLLKLS